MNATAINVTMSPIDYSTHADMFVGLTQPSDSEVRSIINSGNTFSGTGSPEPWFNLTSGPETVSVAGFGITIGQKVFVTFYNNAPIAATFYAYWQEY